MGLVSFVEPSITSKCAAKPCHQPSRD